MQNVELNIDTFCRANFAFRTTSARYMFQQVSTISNHLANITTSRTLPYTKIMVILNTNNSTNIRPINVKFRREGVYYYYKIYT